MKLPPFDRPVFGKAFGSVFGKEEISFSPLDIPGLLGWYDAVDGSTITETGNNVSQWDDKSGNGNHLTQTTEINKPSTNDKTINGLNAIAFDGTTEYLELLSIITTPDFSFAIVFHVESVSNAFDSIFSVDSNEAGNDDFQVDAASASEYFSRLLSGVLGITSLSTSPVDLVGSDAGLLYRLQVSDTSALLYDSSGLVDSDIGYNGDLDNDQHLLIGINRAATVSPVHHIGEVVLVNAAISDADRLSLFKYLNAKWGV